MTPEQARIHTEHFDELAKEKRSRAIDSANAAFRALAADELEDARECFIAAIKQIDDSLVVKGKAALMRDVFSKAL